MPLDRANVTIASRVMLPSYAALNLAFAVAFLSDYQNRLSLAPSLDIARAWMPIERWGILWFTLTALMVMALVVRHRPAFVAALAINAGSWFAWGFLTTAAIFTQPNVSPLAGVLPWFVATASFASMLSLLAGER